MLALGATLITARALGVESFGTLVLVHAYVMLVRGIVNLKPFEAIEVTAAPLRPAAYTLGRARAALFLQIMAVAGYCYLFVQLTPMFGLTGLGIAKLALWSTVLAGMTYLVTAALRAQGPV